MHLIFFPLALPVPASRIGRRAGGAHVTVNSEQAVEPALRTKRAPARRAWDSYGGEGGLEEDDRETLGRYCTSPKRLCCLGSGFIFASAASP